MTENPKPQLKSLRSDQLLDVLDLDRPEMAAVKAANASGGLPAALAALLEYYRQRFPLPAERPAISPARLAEADLVCEHTLQYLGYAPRHYPDPIDWEWDPHGDIEWVAGIYRFCWARPLGEAYAATGDDKYVAAFVELTKDWIGKHPLELHERAHRTLTHWKGFAWLDIQTGIRAAALCDVLPLLIHGASFTPEFLGIMWASLYDHQVKSVVIPMNMVHNKATMEMRGIMDIAELVPEFKETQQWLGITRDRFVENFLAQSSPDGVQREWSFGYHMHVLSDGNTITEMLEKAGLTVPNSVKQRARDMYEFIYGFAMPDLSMPMFGDTRREGPEEARIPRQVYHNLMDAQQRYGDQKFAALAEERYAELPKRASFAWLHAGMYVMRSGWGPDQIVLPFHDSPPPISSHDQLDNGTFELWAYGRWLMNDTGYFTYGHDAVRRTWHRQTAVHQTLTLDGKNNNTLATHRLWASQAGEGGAAFDAVCVDNDAYPGLKHRRAIWFAGRRFFVILDQAIGDAQGTLDLHYQFAPGAVALDVEANRAYTLFPDSNVLVQLAAPEGAVLAGEEGWFAWTYNKRVPRIGLRFRLPQPGAPAHALTIIAPYRNQCRPQVTAALAEGFDPAADRAELTASIDGQTWALGYDLAANRIWCAPQ